MEGDEARDLAARGPSTTWTTQGTRGAARRRGRGPRRAGRGHDLVGRRPGPARRSSRSAARSTGSRATSAAQAGRRSRAARRDRPSRRDDEPDARPARAAPTAQRSSSPTPPTSCAHRSPRSASTPRWPSRTPTRRARARRRALAEGARIQGLVDLLLLARLDEGSSADRDAGRSTSTTSCSTEASAVCARRAPGRRLGVGAPRCRGRRARARAGGAQPRGQRRQARRGRGRSRRREAHGTGPARVEDDGAGIPADRGAGLREVRAARRGTCPRPRRHRARARDRPRDRRAHGGDRLGRRVGARRRPGRGSPAGGVIRLTAEGPFSTFSVNLSATPSWPLQWSYSQTTTTRGDRR